MPAAFLINAGAGWLLFFDISMRFKGSGFRKTGRGESVPAREICGGFQFEKIREIRV
jgi:hypothetical protein